MIIRSTRDAIFEWELASGDNCLFAVRKCGKSSFHTERRFNFNSILRIEERIKIKSYFRKLITDGRLILICLAIAHYVSFKLEGLEKSV